MIFSSNRCSFPKWVAKISLQHINSRVLPRFRIIAKMHRVPTAQRPLVNCNEFVLQLACDWLARALKTLVKRLPCVIHSSLQAVQAIEDLRLPGDIADFRFIEADVDNMFGSILVHFDQRYAGRSLIEVVAAKLPLCASGCQQSDAILKILRFVVDHQLVVFEQNGFLSRDGIGMGLSCSGFLANLYLSLVDEQLRSITELWLRYMDDGLAAVHFSLVDRVVDTLNSFHRQIKCKIKVVPNFANFLDIIAFHVNGKMVVRLFRKAGNRYLYIPTASNHPPKCFHAFLGTEIKRIIRLNTFKADMFRELGFFRQKLINSGYSTTMFNSAVAFVERDFALRRSDIDAVCLKMRSDISDEAGDRDVAILVMPFDNGWKFPAFARVLNNYVQHFGFATKIAWTMSKSMFRRFYSST